MGDADVVAELGALSEVCRKYGFDDQADRIDQRERDHDAPLFVMIVGEGKFGKSTLINALVGHDVAPVSRLPKTWKVDLYESAEQSGALLYWQSQIGEPQPMSIEEARVKCDQEEKKAQSKADSSRESWKSDLYQVRWRAPLSWPSGNVALVDTPGFSQLRSDVAVVTKSLFGVDGIEFEAADAFEYYYYRSDVVLWCFKATKLNDQDTLDALRLVAASRKEILGVITHMDRIPRERWSEVQDQAHAVFGEYVSEFVPMAAGGDSALRDETVSALRTLCESRFTSCASARKAEAAAAFLAGERAVMASYFDGIFAAMINNVRTHERLAVEAGHIGGAAHAEAERKLANAISSIRKGSAGKVAGIWDSSAGDVGRFRAAVKSQFFGRLDVGIRLNRVLDEAVANTQIEVERFHASIAWDGIVVGSNDAKVVTRGLDSLALAGTSTVATPRIDVDLGLLADEGIFGTLARVFDKLRGGAGAQSKVIAAMEGLLVSSRGSAMAALDSLQSRSREAAGAALKTSYNKHVGLSRQDLELRAKEFDVAANRAGLASKKYRGSVVPQTYASRLGLAEYARPESFYWLELAKQEGDRPGWDSAVRAEWSRIFGAALVGELRRHGVFESDRWVKAATILSRSVASQIREQGEGVSAGDRSFPFFVSGLELLKGSKAVKEIEAIIPSWDDLDFPTLRVELEALHLMTGAKSPLSSLKSAYNTWRSEKTWLAGRMQGLTLNDADSVANTIVVDLMLEVLSTLSVAQFSGETLRFGAWLEPLQSTIRSMRREIAPPAALSFVDTKKVVRLGDSAVSQRMWVDAVDGLALLIMRGRLKTVLFDGAFSKAGIQNLTDDVTNAVFSTLQEMSRKELMRADAMHHVFHGKDIFRLAGLDSIITNHIPDSDIVFDKLTLKRLNCLLYRSEDSKSSPTSTLLSSYRKWRESLVVCTARPVMCTLLAAERATAILVNDYLSQMLSRTSGLLFHNASIIQSEFQPRVPKRPPLANPELMDFGGFVLRVGASSTDLLGGCVGSGRVLGADTSPSGELHLVWTDGSQASRLARVKTARLKPLSEKQATWAYEERGLSQEEIAQSQNAKFYARGQGYRDKFRLTEGSLICSGDWASALGLSDETVQAS